MKHSLMSIKKSFFNNRMFTTPFRNLMVFHQLRVNSMIKSRALATMKLTSTPKYCFATAETDRKITPKILCDIIGTKYYPHNEEIDMGMNAQVRLFDENETHIGVVTLAEAREKAAEHGFDLVLRNANLSPPVLKIMNYRKELIKRLYQKLGKKVGESDGEKSKVIKITTQITVHDLENKKRQAIQFLKKSPILKIYIKVNQYDPENVQKGRLMLTNIAEELRSHSKIKVAPTVVSSSSESEEPKQKAEKKSFDDFKTEAEQKVERELAEKDQINIEEHEEEDSGLQNVYMELESTVCNAVTDAIDEGASLEEFLQNLYQGKVKEEEKKEEGALGETDKDKPELTFGIEEESKEEFNKARDRVKLKKRLRKRSAIFDTADLEFKQEDSEVVDLTEYVKIEDQNIEVNEYDLLNSDINPLDVDTLKKVKELRDKLEFERLKVKGKNFFKMFRDSQNDPLGIHKEMQKEVA